MKRFFQIAGMALFITLFTDLRNPAAAQPGGDVSYQNFYDELSPYGRWIDYPDYGYVWCPDEGRDFRPYSTNGRWVWSDEFEWMWVSDYSWGWAPFHYGRWFYDDFNGWMWVPGYDWSPAWVAWRGGGDYYGWAPLRPGINISIGFSIGNYNPPVNYWCFAPSRYITSSRIYDYCVSPRQNVTIINNTTIINNYNYNRNVFVTGPRRNDVERFTNQRISSVRVRDISNPGRSGFRNNEVSVYRPGINRDNNRNYAPRQFENYRRGSDNSIARERDNRLNNRNGFGDRVERNSNPRFENRNAERPNGLNDRIERRAQPDRGQARPDNNVRERSARDVFGRDNRPGFDQPARQNRFERRNEPVNNDNRIRNNENNENNRRFEPQRQQEQPRRFEPQRQQEQPRRFEAQRQQEQPRRFEAQRQQEQPRRIESQRQQEQPRRFETQRGGNNGDNNHGGFNRGRRG